MSLQDSGCWEDPDPAKCPCQGRGWLISDLDTAHWCSYHGVGVLPPEDCGGDRRFEAHAKKNPGLYACVRAEQLLGRLLKGQPGEDPPLMISAKEVREVKNVLSQTLTMIEMEQEKTNENLRQHRLNDILNSQYQPQDESLLDAWKERQKILNADTIPEDKKLYAAYTKRRTERLTVYKYDSEPEGGYGDMIVIGHRPEFFSKDQLPRMEHLKVTDHYDGLYYRNPKPGEPQYIDPPKEPKEPPATDDRIPF
jgi:hypothetical protein